MKSLFVSLALILVLVATAAASIRSQCENKWGNNYQMLKFCIDQQTEAKRELQSY